jgi:hypothetical protein
MAFDKDFLTGVFEGVEGADSRIEKVLKEYEADITGLKVKRDELHAKSNDYKKELEKLTSDYGTEKAAFQKQIEDYETKLKASGSDELKAFHEAELKKIHDSYAARITDYEAKNGQHEKAYSKLNSEYLEVLKNTELDKAMDKVQNLDRSKANILRDTFWGRNKFEHQTIDGVKKLMNQEYRSVGDVLNAFIGTDEGKFFLLSNNSGGGATGATVLRPSTANPYLKDSFNLTRQMELAKDNPTLAASLESAAWIKT